MRTSNFFFSPQFRDLTDIQEGQRERDIHEGQKWGGRREHVNIDTTAGDPIVSMSKEKIGSQNACFPQKQKPIGGIGPLAQKDLIQREFCPLTVAKGPEGRFPRLSKAVKVTAEKGNNGGKGRNQRQSPSTNTDVVYWHLVNKGHQYGMFRKRTQGGKGNQRPARARGAVATGSRELSGLGIV